MMGSNSNVIRSLLNSKPLLDTPTDAIPMEVGGDVHLTTWDETHCPGVEADMPNAHRRDLLFSKLEPKTTTTVPPSSGPLAGYTDVTTGTTE